MKFLPFGISLSVLSNTVAVVILFISISVSTLDLSISPFVRCAYNRCSQMYENTWNISRTNIFYLVCGWYYIRIFILSDWLG